MKPTTQYNEIRSGRDSVDQTRLRGAAAPKTDYTFQAASLAQFGGRCKGTKESFRSISGAYFKEEAGHAFALEAGLFALIATIAALPIASSISALIHLVRAISL
jgi:hypothetical protein